MLFTPAEIKPVISIEAEIFFFPRGGCVSRLRACLGARLLPQSYQYRNLSEGADRVGGQLRGDKECPFSGVTKSGIVLRKVKESDARSVGRKTVLNWANVCSRTYLEVSGEPSWFLIGPTFLREQSWKYSSKLYCG